MLIEKMVNPKTVLETPHFMMDKSTQPGFTPFNAVQYLICTQKVSQFKLALDYFCQLLLPPV